MHCAQSLGAQGGLAQRASACTERQLWLTFSKFFSCLKPNPLICTLGPLSSSPHSHVPPHLLSVLGSLVRLPAGALSLVFHGRASGYLSPNDFCQLPPVLDDGPNEKVTDRVHGEGDTV